MSCQVSRLVLTGHYGPLSARRVRDSRQPGYGHEELGHRQKLPEDAPEGSVNPAKIPQTASRLVDRATRATGSGSAQAAEVARRTAAA